MRQYIEFKVTLGNILAILVNLIAICSFLFVGAQWVQSVNDSIAHLSEQQHETAARLFRDSDRITALTLNLELLSQQLKISLPRTIETHTFGKFTNSPMQSIDKLKGVINHDQ